MKLLKNALLAAFAGCALYAGDYEDGVELYKKELFAESMLCFEKAAESKEPSGKQAQYHLGYMHENGLGVKKDIDKAAYWYKRAASDYQNTAAKTVADAKTKTPQAPYLYYIDPALDSDMNRQMFNRLDMPENFEERQTLMSKVFSNFGLFPYQKNFLLPFVYTSENYARRDQTAFPGYGEYKKNSEAEFQISLKKALVYDLLGFNEILSFGYTQEVWWQVYADSAPFREINYRPELWLTLPIQGYAASKVGLKAVKIGYMHESNGQSKSLSRAWDKIYTDFIFQHGALITELRAWHANSLDGENKDITAYLGYGHLKLNYFLGKHQFDLTLRNNLRFEGENRGSIEGEWSYPIGGSQNSFWYVKAFSGYGASLIDYNHAQNRIGLGFLFSR